MIVTATHGDLRLAQLPFIIDMLFIVYVRKLCYRGSGLNYLLRLSSPAGRFCCMPYMSLYTRTPPRTPHAFTWWAPIRGRRKKYTGQGKNTAGNGKYKETLR